MNKRTEAIDKYLAIWEERTGQYKWFVRGRDDPSAARTIKLPGVKEKTYHATGRFIKGKDGMQAEIFEALNEDEGSIK